MVCLRPQPPWAFSELKQGMWYVLHWPHSKPENERINELQIATAAAWRLNACQMRDLAVLVQRQFPHSPSAVQRCLNAKKDWD